MNRYQISRVGESMGAKLISRHGHGRRRDGGEDALADHEGT